MSSDDKAAKKEEAAIGLDRAVVNRRHLLLGGALVAVAGIAYARQPQVIYPVIEKTAFEELIPDIVGPWKFESASGVVLPPPDELSDRLYDNLVTRTYGAATAAPVMFLTAYSNTQDGVLQVHRPEICYPAGGYELTETEQISIDNGVGGSLPANTFAATGRGRTEHVLYWTRIGDEFPAAWSDQRIAVIKANLRGEIPDGVLVRMSTISPDREAALAQLRSFAVEFNRSMGTKGRALLSGIPA